MHRLWFQNLNFETVRNTNFKLFSSKNKICILGVKYSVRALRKFHLFFYLIYKYIYKNIFLYPKTNKTTSCLLKLRALLAQIGVKRLIIFYMCEESFFKEIVNRMQLKNTNTFCFFVCFFNKLYKQNEEVIYRIEKPMYFLLLCWIKTRLQSQ